MFLGENKEYLQEYLDYEKQYLDLIHQIDTSYPKPLNSKEERKKFFKKLKKKEIYNPQFKFENKEISEESLQKLQELSSSIKLYKDEYHLKKLLKQKIEEDILLLKCHKQWGNKHSCNYSIKIYNSPSMFLVLRAKLFCRNFQRERVKFKRITAKKVGEELQREVKRLTGDTIKVQYKRLANKMNIIAHSKLIEINPSESYTSLDLERLKVHEIGVHYIRYYNAKQLTPVKLFERGTDHYIATEEGLAVYSEERAGVLSKAQMYIYAGRVLATYYAQKMDFYSLYHYLKQYGYKDNDAFSLALRAKRNLEDTSKLGGYTKDHIYFKGYYEVKAFAKKYPLHHLFFGKFKIEDYKYLKPLIIAHEKEIKTIFMNNK